MEIEKKIKNPIRIELVSNICALDYVKTNDENGKEKRILLEHGCMFGSENYGIEISLMGNEDTIASYSTQFRVVAVEARDEDIIVWEEGKYNPWVLNYKGEIKETSSFLTLSRRDITFLRDEFKLDPDDALREFLINHKWDLNTRKLYSDENADPEEIISKYGKAKVMQEINRIIAG